MGLNRRELHVGRPNRASRPRLFALFKGPVLPLSDRSPPSETDNGSLAGRQLVKIGSPVKSGLTLYARAAYRMNVLGSRLYELGLAAPLASPITACF